MLVEIRAVVAGVQPAVEPVRVSPQDVAARLPVAAANVRAFVDFSLGKAAASLCYRMRIWRLSDIKISCSRFWTKWRWVGEEASLARAALPSDELPGSFSHFGHSSR